MIVMAKKDKSTELWLKRELRDIELMTADLWQIFKDLHAFWQRPESELVMLESRFDQFVSNRIECNSDYVFRYLGAIRLLNQMELTQTRWEVIRKLCTDHSANIYPPSSSLAKARQFVANEFAKFYMSVGGFKMFGSLKNHPGYVGGMNLSENTPYITYTETL